ncbi:MAG: hypothetical protein IJ328_06130 [Muribaculaceae bacterium]|nr:hypothetical protein [Muribaculaceae bacterium]
MECRKVKILSEEHRIEFRLELMVLLEHIIISWMLLMSIIKPTIEVLLQI